MEASKDPILFRSSKIQQVFAGKPSSGDGKLNVLTLEGLLDALLVLYDECNNESIKENDKHVDSFVNKFRTCVMELRCLRVNIGDFEVHKVIGRGHFGEVQVVREKQTGEVHAMKTLRKSDTLAQENMAFYEEERDIMAKAQSPWITRLHWAFQDANHLYLVMEFHPGGDLLALMDRQDDVLPVESVRFYMAEITLAIHSLHQMGYVHRDIKPDNILIDRTGHVKLADFGSAAKLSIYGKAESAMPVGTPDYIAPEVLTAMNSNKMSTTYGVECDWWSLGIVGYEMLCGITPFASDKPTITYANIMNHKNTLTWPSDLQLPNDAINVISNLLEETENRLDFVELCKHHFFARIDWHNIRNTVPPFVPKVSAQDDTSNFEKFAREPHLPSRDDFKARKSFSGKNLPFVGFTYTHCLVPGPATDRRRSTCDENASPMINKITKDDYLASKKKEMADMLQRVSSLEKSQMGDKIKITKLQKDLIEKEEALKSVKLEKEASEKDLAKCVSEVMKMKRFLELERNERLLNEKRALKLIGDAQDKWKREEEDLKNKLQSKEAVVAEIEPKYLETQSNELKYRRMMEAMAKEVSDTRKKVEEYKGKLRRMMGNKRESMGEVHVMLKQMELKNEEAINNLQKNLETAIASKRSLKGKITDLEMMLTQKDEQLRKMGNERRVSVSSEKQMETQLRNELTLEKEKCVSLEDKISELELSERDFSAREFAFQELQNQLREESDNTRMLQDKLALLETSIQGTVGQQLEALQKGHKQMVVEIQNLNHEKKELDNEKIKLETELQAAEEKQRTHKQEIEELQAVVLRLEESLKAAEVKSQDCGPNSGEIVTGNGYAAENVTESQEKQNFLEAQVTKLETQLSRVRDVSSADKQRIRELQDELRKVQKELSDVKLDLRISQREAKKAQEQITSLTSVQETLETNLKESGQQICLLQEKEGVRCDEIKNFEVALALKKQELENRGEAFAQEEMRWKETIKELEEKNKGADGIRCQMEKLQYQNEELVTQKKMLEDQMKLMDQLKLQHGDRENALRNELQEKTQKCKSLEQTMNVLKSTCIMLEGQLKDFEILVENHETKEHHLKTEKFNLVKNVTDSENELETTKKHLAEEKSERLKLEKSLQDLNTKLDMIKVAQAAESCTLKDELNQHKSTVMQYNDELNSTEQKLMACERALKTYQQRSQGLEMELVKMKEEASALITNVNSLKESNFKLTLGLEEAIDKCEDAKSRINDVENDLETTRVSQNVERTKLQETIAQQTKLIDFLQAKTQGTGKRKTLQEKLFGRSIRIARSPNNEDKHGGQKGVLENQSNKDTKPKHSVSQSQVGTPQTRVVLSAITQSPGVQETPEEILAHDRNSTKAIVPNPTQERMHHNIPHRFQTALTMRATKCGACLDTIHFGRSSAKCQECQLMFHPKCASSVPSTCGLPSGLIQHFRQSLRKRSSSRFLPVQQDKDKAVQGWVKIPRKNKLSWEQKFARIEGGSLLCLYDKENAESNTPTDTLELCPENGETVVHGAVSPAELLSTAKSDLAYILKLELIPLTTCWPGKTLYLMAPSFQEKQRWVSECEMIAGEHAKKRKKMKDAKLLGSVVLHVEEDRVIDVNCVVHLDSRLLLVGAEEGLFVVDLKEKASQTAQKVEGIDSVFQIEIVESLDCFILITGEDRALCQLSLSVLGNAVRSNTRLACDPSPIEFVRLCHLFAAKQTAEATLICAATAEKLFLCKYNMAQRVFCIQKELMTSEPCSCLHFTKNSILVGADRYFEIDLRDLTVEEFLDSSDTSLAYAVYATAQVNSFPVAILEVNPSNETPTEYLLCFHEFGIFVDSFGRRTRKGDMKWTRLPLAFAYQAPYLFIAHFNSLEVMKITRQSEKSNGKHTFLNVNSPRYLGQSFSKSGGIYLASLQDNNLDVFCLQGNLASVDAVEIETESKEDGSETDTLAASSESEFSFSSSVMNILEPSADVTIDSSEYSEIGSIKRYR